MRKILAKRLRPLQPQFVSIVHRGAARKVWKVLKSENGEGSEMEQQAGDDRMLGRLVARKASIERLITDLRGSGTPTFEATLAQKGTTAAAVHSLVFDGTYTDAQARAWTEARGLVVQKIDGLDAGWQVRVHPSEPGDAEFAPVAIGTGVSAICFATPPEVAQKTDPLGVLDSVRTALVASIQSNTFTAALAQKMLHEAGDTIAASGGGADEGAAMTIEELAKKVDDLVASVTPLSAQVTELATKMDGKPWEKAPAAAADAETPKDEADPCDEADKAKKAEEATVARKAELDASLAPVLAALDTVQKSLEGRLDKLEGRVPARRGIVPEERRVLEEGIARKTDTTFDSAFPWGRRSAQA